MDDKCNSMARIQLSTSDSFSIANLLAGPKSRSGDDDPISNLRKLTSLPKKMDQAADSIQDHLANNSAQLNGKLNKRACYEEGVMLAAPVHALHANHQLINEATDLAAVSTSTDIGRHDQDLIQDSADSGQSFFFFSFFF